MASTIFKTRQAGLRLWRFPVCFILIWFILSAACAHTTGPEPARLEIDLSQTYPLYEKSAPTPSRWWEGFGSEELNDLVGKALQSSPSLRISLARLEQSKSEAVRVGADKLPDLNLRAGFSETRRSTGNETVTDSSRSLTLASSWELDFWGRIRAEHMASLLDVESSREDLYSSAITLSSEVTLKWLEIISVRRQLDLFAQQLETNRTILDLMEQRYLKGLANALDIYQQRQAVAENEAGIPLLEANLENLKSELAVLVGKLPGTELDLTAKTFPDPGPPPETGLPADLLSNRPDVRRAGLELRAAESRVAAAKANRLPEVTLSATGGFSSDSLADLLEKWLATLAANLAWPLFNAGADEAEVTRREKIVEERLANYERAVLEAILEVREAIVSEFKQKIYIEGLEKQLAISRDGFREAVSRYRKGLSDYLPVLSALTSTQRLERSIVQAQLERISQRVKLHRSLGGGWVSDEFE